MKKGDRPFHIEVWQYNSAVPTNFIDRWWVYRIPEIGESIYIPKLGKPLTVYQSTLYINEWQGEDEYILLVH